MKTIAKIGALAMTSLVLGACESNYNANVPGAMDVPGFGDAVRANIAAETVNPRAGEDTRPIETDGATTAIAVGRYEHDLVKAPEDTGMTSMDDPSGSSSGSGASGGMPGAK